MKSAFFLIMASALLMPSLCLEISGIYSDLQSSDVTVEGLGRSDLRVDLSSQGNVIQSRTLQADGPGTWIVGWESVPSKEGSYSVRARLYENGSLASEKTFDFHYGGQVPVRFDVRDFQADNRGAHLLIYSPDMAMVDIYQMLIKDGKALYVARDRSLPISDGTRRLDLDWKQLLENGENYTGRVKIVEMETGQTRSFMSPFLAQENARITETYGDEIGASATIIGDSMVPLSGTVKFILSQGGKTLVSEEKRTPVLLKDDDETVEVSWNRTLDPGIYHLKIDLLGGQGEPIDFREIVIEAKKSSNLTAAKETPKESSQSTTPALAVAGILALAGAVYVIRKRR